MILEKNFKPFTRLYPDGAPDGSGGFPAIWREGETVQAVCIQTDTDAENTAQKPDAKAQYTLLTRRAVSLPFHAVLRRESDGRMFRITDDAADRKTPESAKLDLRMHKAEEYRP